jgi:hypothetical protein
MKRQFMQNIIVIDRFDFLAHFPLGKESYCPHFVRSSVRPFVRSSVRPFVRSSVRPFVRSSVRPFVRSSVRPSVTASSLQGVVGLGWFMACSKAYEPRIWIMVKKILGIDPGHGQEVLKSLTLYIFLEYLWTFYKCVCEQGWLTLKIW